MKTRYRIYGEETGVLPRRQGVKETVDSLYNSDSCRTFTNFISRTSKQKTTYRVHSEETGVLPLRQDVKETVDSLYNSEYYTKGINQLRNDIYFFSRFVEGIIYGLGGITSESQNLSELNYESDTQHTAKKLEYFILRQSVKEIQIRPITWNSAEFLLDPYLGPRLDLYVLLDLYLGPRLDLHMYRIPQIDTATIIL